MPALRMLLTGGEWRVSFGGQVETGNLNIFVFLLFFGRMRYVVMMLMKRNINIFVFFCLWNKL